MQFSCTQENLHQGLSIVSHIAGKSINLPVLGNVLIKADEKTLKLISTNLEVAIQYVVRGKVDVVGEFTVPSRLFADYVGLLPKERVDVVMDGNALTVSCGTFQTKLNGIPASEFPLIPTVDGQQRFLVKAAEFRRAIAQVLFAVTQNESRPEISGVLFKFSPENGALSLILAATDSYRLAERRLMAASADGGHPLKDPVSVIVPARTVAEVVRILGVFRDGVGSPEDLEIHFGDSQVLFSYGGMELVSRIIEGKYPDYRQLIPEKFETEAILPKNELSRAVKTASLFSRTGLNDVHFGFDADGKVTLSAVNSQTGEHAVSLDGEVQGKPNEVTVNFRYFLDGVNNMESDAVRLQLNDNVSPCIVRPKEGNDYLYIVMPIRQ